MSSRRRKKIIEEEEEEWEQSEDDEGEISDGEDAEREGELVFEDGYGSDLMGDEIDRHFLSSLSMIEREKILDERARQREALQERYEAAIAYKQQQKDKKKGHSRKSKRVKKVSKTSEALKDLQKRRRHKAETKQTDISYLSESGEEYEEELPKNIAKNRSRTFEKADSNELTESSDICLPIKKTPITLTALRHIQFRRMALERYCDEPFFSSMIQGGFVRYGLGETKNTGVKIYRICEIVDVVEGKRFYKFGNKETKLCLSLRIGRNSRDCKMDMVSNHSITDEEMNYWIELCKKQEVEIPTVEECMDRKRKTETISKDFIYSGDVVEQMLEKKRKTKTASLVNISSLNISLIQQREEAKERNDFQLYQQLSNEIEDLEEEVKKVKRKQDINSDRQSFSIKQINAKMKKYNQQLEYIPNKQSELQITSEDKSQNSFTNSFELLKSYHDLQLTLINPPLHYIFLEKRRFLDPCYNYQPSSCITINEYYKNNYLN